MSSAISTGSWAQARSLTDLGELTAQWLEGKIIHQPGYRDPDPGEAPGPDPETIPLVPVLAACNRAGFVTCGSQPGSDGPGSDGANWRQRAAAEGYASGDVLRQLRKAADPGRTGLLVIAHLASRWRYRYGRAVPVTRTDGCDPRCRTRHADGCDWTWFGTQVPRRHFRDAHIGYGECHRDAVDALCAAWQVTIIDPQWGRNEVLWPALERWAAGAG